MPKSPTRTSQRKSKKTDKSPASSTTSWAEFQERLRNSSDPAHRHPLFSAAHFPLQWGLPSETEIAAADTSTPVASVARLERLARSKRDSASKADKGIDWNVECESFLRSLLVPVDRRSCELALAWAYAAPQLASRLSPPNWTMLFQTLVQLVIDLLDEGPPEDLVVEQRLVELGIVLQGQFPEASELAAVSDDLHKRLSYAITDLTDGEGVPRAAAILDLRSLVAGWMRIALIAKQTDTRLLDEEAQMQLEWLVRQSVVLSRTGGLPLFLPPDSNRLSQPATDDFFTAALAWEGDEDDRSYAATLIAQGPFADSSDKKLRKMAGELELHFDSPTLYSEWASLAVMRSRWDSAGPVAGVAFDRQTLLIDVSLKRGPLFLGDTTPFIRLNGQLIELQSDFSEVCWHSDDDCDYLEVEAALGDDWRLQRQYLFGRTDQFLWVADVLVGPKACEIDYTCRWPLADNVTWNPAAETRDGTLEQDGRRIAAVIAPAAAEWRVSRSVDEVDCVDGQLQHRYKSQAAAAYIPLFVDLDRKRTKKERTWRQLTVAESLKIVSPEMAVGFRVQAGLEQWLFYRSLGPRGNRSVMGQNTVAEFLAGRFQRDGLLDELVEVE